MELIILAGNSLKNLDWSKRIAKLLHTPIKPKVQIYSHWETRKKFIDLDREQKKLIDTVKHLNNYTIFGKSVGAILALKAIYENQINPQKCIFAGTAIAFAKSNDYPVENWLQNYSTPTLFLQNTNDPAIFFADLTELLQKNKVKNYKLIELSGETHDYDTETTTNLIKNFLLE